MKEGAGGGSLLLAPLFSRSLTLVTRSFLLNRTETLATQARESSDERTLNTQRIEYVFFQFDRLLLLFIFADQVFIDPTFFGIFVCGPLQSFVVNVCTLWDEITRAQI